MTDEVKRKTYTVTFKLRDPMYAELPIVCSIAGVYGNDEKSVIAFALSALSSPSAWELVGWRLND